MHLTGLVKVCKVNTNPNLSVCLWYCNDVGHLCRICHIFMKLTTYNVFTFPSTSFLSRALLLGLCLMGLQSGFLSSLWQATLGSIRDIWLTNQANNFWFLFSNSTSSYSSFDNFTNIKAIWSSTSPICVGGKSLIWYSMPPICTWSKSSMEGADISSVLVVFGHVLLEFWWRRQFPLHIFLYLLGLAYSLLFSSLSTSGLLLFELFSK